MSIISLVIYMAFYPTLLVGIAYMAFTYIVDNDAESRALFTRKGMVEVLALRGYLAGIDNKKGINGLALFKKHSSDLDDKEKIGTWVEPKEWEKKDVAKADKIPNDDLNWEIRHFETQPARIRMHKQPTEKRIFQIYYNIASREIRTGRFSKQDHVDLFEIHPIEKYINFDFFVVGGERNPV
jgi:hypothetical protein